MNEAKATSNLPVDRLIAGGRVVAGGIPEGFDALLIALLVAGKDGKVAPILHVARDGQRLTALEDALDFFAPDVKRQGIVDSWPVDVDDTAARRDWGWKPRFNLVRAYDEYLIPGITRRYRPAREG